MLTFHFNLPSEDLGAEAENSLFVNRGGEIYLETEQGYFPCLGWPDLLLVVVDQWISNTITMLESKDGMQTVTNYFMDGPYAFSLQYTEQDRLLIRFLKRVGEPEETERLPSLQIAVAAYCDALVALGDNIIRDPGFRWLGREQERIHFQQVVAMLKAWVE